MTISILGIQDVVPLEVGNFSYFPPKIDYVRPSVASTRGGSLVTILGSNFGSSIPQIYIGPSLCFDVVLLSDSSAMCTVPKGIGSDLTVTVAQAGQNGSMPNGFQYTLPTIDVGGVDERIRG